MRIEINLETSEILELEDAPIIERPIEEIEAERISQIKSKAREIITSKYTIEWQLNHPRLDETYSLQYEWIDNIRKISNEAESNGTKVEDINWAGLDEYSISDEITQSDLLSIRKLVKEI